MRTTALVLGFATASLSIVGVAAFATGERSASSANSANGASLYNRYCLACHGAFGDGQGPATPWLWPRPRDFTRGDYKWRTTSSGSPPADSDLALVIRRGVPGTSMHGFASALSEGDVSALVAHLKGFAPERFESAPEAVPVPPTPTLDASAIARGKEVYQSLGCVACHGAEGKGDGVAAANLRSVDGLPAGPYDLTAVPLRRPTADAPAVADIYQSLVTGLSGTPMPSYKGAAPDADVWAVAAYIDSIRFRGPAPAERNAPRLARTTIQLDRKEKRARKGYYPANGTPQEMAILGQTVPLQGEAPAALAPAQRSLRSQQCARCHSKQLREWRGSLHASAGSPGLLGQVERVLRAGRRRGKDRGAYAEDCLRCHAPLAEAQPVLRPGQRGGDDSVIAYTRNRSFDEALQKEGLGCASCHVRGWTRLGPPLMDESKLLDLPSYPRIEAQIYERSDFCLPCHQLPARTAKNGRPFLDTYREWLEGPYMRRGIQCQHCHMPNREHTWKGVHDPETFRQGIDLDVIAGRSADSGVVSVRARVSNVGAGHFLPTTPTPAAWLRIELVDRDGVAITGASEELRIGRYLEFNGKFIEHEDTRIPPGESVELARAWKRGRVPAATHARITLRVWPDDYYERLYRYRLKADLDDDIRAMFEEALAWAEGNRYVAIDRLVAIEPIEKK